MTPEDVLKVTNEQAKTVRCQRCGAVAGMFCRSLALANSIHIDGLIHYTRRLAAFRMKRRPCSDNGGQSCQREDQMKIQKEAV